MRRLLAPMLLSLALTSGGWSQSPASRLQREVMVKTSFAHNYGMLAESVLFEGTEYPLQEAAAAILPALGWSNPQWRLELAKAWVNHVELIGISAVNSEEIDVETTELGYVEVTLWVRVPTGNHPAAFSRNRYTFSPDGVLTAQTIETR